MKKTSLIIFCLSIIASLGCNAQDDLKKLSFKKGEVLDILFLSTIDNPKQLFDRYKKTALPVAFEYSYKPQPGFKTSNLILGNNLPSNFIFGKWDSKEKREGFLENITKKVPDFHQQRRDLFPIFQLTYYELDKDTEFSINTAKYNVVTSFWNSNSKASTEFLKQWKNDLAATGGNLIIKLKQGTSPVGYYYNPDVLIIAEWNSKEDFNQFLKKYPLKSYNQFKNIQQFVIE